MVGWFNKEFLNAAKLLRIAALKRKFLYDSAELSFLGKALEALQVYERLWLKLNRSAATAIFIFSCSSI